MFKMLYAILCVVTGIAKNLEYNLVLEDAFNRGLYSVVANSVSSVDED